MKTKMEKIALNKSMEHQEEYNPAEKRTENIIRSQKRKYEKQQVALIEENFQKNNSRDFNKNFGIACVDINPYVEISNNERGKIMLSN